jgi:transposase InsO family protein
MGGIHGQEGSMKLHSNAKLTPKGRLALVRAVKQDKLTLNAAAAAFKVSTVTARKWVQRFGAEGAAGLADRSSRPARLRAPTPPKVIRRIEQLRRSRMTGARIAALTGVSSATVSRVLKRLGLSHLSALDPEEPARRYEHACAGDLLHLDTKKLGRILQPGHRVTGDRRDHTRGAGWETVFVAIDDHSRVAYAELAADETVPAAVAFLQAAVRYYAGLGITIRRVMTDNGPAFRSHAFAQALATLGLRHIRTRPYTPRTNGKAERFIQSALREWAYGFVYRHSTERATMLNHWLHHYNWHRPHSALNDAPPASRLSLSRNDLLRTHS